MKTTLYFFALATLSLSALSGEPATKEVEIVEGLIKLSERTVETQKNLRTLLIDYQKENKNYVEHPDDKEALFKTAKLALRVSQVIQENHLEHLFTQEFMSELNLFAQIGKKMGIPRS